MKTFEQFTHSVYEKQARYRVRHKQKMRRGAACLTMAAVLGGGLLWSFYSSNTPGLLTQSTETQTQVLSQTCASYALAGSAQDGGCEKSEAGTLQQSPALDELLIQMQNLSSAQLVLQDDRVVPLDDAQTLRQLSAAFLSAGQRSSTADDSQSKAAQSSAAQGCTLIINGTVAMTVYRDGEVCVGTRHYSLGGDFGKEVYSILSPYAGEP